jgi:hypothetical protein
MTASFVQCSAALAHSDMLITERTQKLLLVTIQNERAGPGSVAEELERAGPTIL